MDQRLHRAAVAAVGVVGLSAAVLSFRHQASLAAASGEAAWSSKLVPIITDGILVAGTMALLDASHRDRSKKWPRITVALGIAMTLFGNIVHGMAWGWHGLIEAAWSPVAVILAVEVLAAMARGVVPAAGSAVPDNKATFAATAQEERVDAEVSQQSVISEPASNAEVPNQTVHDVQRIVPLQPEEAVAAPSNKATRKSKRPPAAAAERLEQPPADVLDAINAGTPADDLAQRFSDLTPYRAKQLVRQYSTPVNGKDLEETG